MSQTLIPPFSSLSLPSGLSFQSMMSDSAKARRGGHDLNVSAEVSEPTGALKEFLEVLKAGPFKVCLPAERVGTCTWQSLVKGDLVIIEAGQRVPADLRIISVDGLKVRLGRWWSPGYRSRRPRSEDPSTRCRLLQRRCLPDCSLCANRIS